MIHKLSSSLQIHLPKSIPARNKGQASRTSLVVRMTGQQTQFTCDTKERNGEANNQVFKQLQCVLTITRLIIVGFIARLQCGPPHQTSETFCYLQV